jgi:hypothetical protein
LWRSDGFNILASITAGQVIEQVRALFGKRRLVSQFFVQIVFVNYDKGQLSALAGTLKKNVGNWALCKKSEVCRNLCK